MIYKIETDDRDEAEILFNATHLFCTLCEIKAYIRCQLKHGNLGAEGVKELEAINSIIFESLARSDISSKIC